MPFKFEFDKTVGVIRETWTGTVDLKEIKDSCLQEWAHPDYRRRMPMISDFVRQRPAWVQRTLCNLHCGLATKIRLPDTPLSLRARVALALRKCSL